MLYTNRPVVILKKIFMNKETEAIAHTIISHDGEQPTDLLRDDQKHTHADIVAFGQLLRESEIQTKDIIPLMLDSFATARNPLSFAALKSAVCEIFPSWENPTSGTSRLLIVSRASGHNLAIIKIGKNTNYHLLTASEDTELPKNYRHRGITKTDTLRRLIEEGTHTNGQIMDILFPNMDRARKSKNLTIHLNQLRDRLREENAYIPDRRLSPEADLRILYNKTALLEEGTPTVLESDATTERIVDDWERTTEAKKKRKDLPLTTREVIPHMDRRGKGSVGVQQIPDVIEKRAALRSESNISKLIRYKDPDTQLLYAQIETPNGRRTKPLNLSLDELNLFLTIFENSDVYTRVKLELAMVDISRSSAYESSGGFELTFNSLNQKILKDWKICITFNDDGCAVLGSPDQHQNLAIDTQHTESDYSGRQPGNVRKRRANHS